MYLYLPALMVAFACFDVGAILQLFMGQDSYDTDRTFCTVYLRFFTILCVLTQEMLHLLKVVAFPPFLSLSDLNALVNLY